MSTLEVVVGGQFGSEGKGAVTAFLARQYFKDGIAVDVVRVAGPNAGHTAIGIVDGMAWKLRQVPVAAVTNLAARLFIGAGSEIDPEVLNTEIVTLDKAGYDVSSRLYIDNQATIITNAHKYAEASLVGRIGSTGKGIGAARSARVMRKAVLWGQESQYAGFNTGSMIGENDRSVLIEGTQGYGLGLHTSYYPKCTSSDCRAIDFVAMAGVDPFSFDIYRPIVVFRTYPIRVAGKSGELLGETTWADLGLEEERTTVTHKVRRVGAWDTNLARQAMAANGVNAIPALTMVDYVENQYPSRTAAIEYYSKEIGQDVEIFGVGPSTKDYFYV